MRQQKYFMVELAAKKAEETSKRNFYKKGIGEDLPEIKLKKKNYKKE